MAKYIQEKIFACFGKPLALRQDQGGEFRGHFGAICSALGVEQHRISPYTSHSNGAVERLHRTVEDLLRRCLVTLPLEHWETLIPELQLTINTTYARSIGCPPYLVMFGADSP